MYRRRQTSTPLRPSVSSQAESFETECYRNSAILSLYMETKERRTLRKLKTESSDELALRANCVSVLHDDILELAEKKNKLQELLRQENLLKSKLQSLDRLEGLVKQIENLSSNIKAAITSNDGIIPIEKHDFENANEIRTLSEKVSNQFSENCKETLKFEPLAETTKAFDELIKMASELAEKPKKIDEKVEEVKELVMEYQTNSEIVDIVTKK